MFLTHIGAVYISHHDATDAAEILIKQADINYFITTFSISVCSSQ